VQYRVELSTGFLATGVAAGGEWDVDDWNDATDALWGGTERAWTDITSDWIDLQIKRGRRRRGSHYTAGTGRIRLSNREGTYSPTQPPEADINLTIGSYFRVLAIHNGISHVRFVGTVRSVVDTTIPGKSPIVTINLVDAFGYLAGLNRVAVSAVGGSELSGARIDRLLDDLSWPEEDRLLDAGVETMQATTKAGNLLTELYLTADSDGGELLINRAGMIVFRDRNTVEYRAGRDPALTVAGYSDPGGEGPWIAWAGYSPEYALDRIINEAAIGRVGGTVQTTTDTTSISTYGKRSALRTDLLNESDVWPAALAAQIVASRKDAAELITSVELTDGDGDATDAVLRLELGDPIRTRRLIGSGASEYEVDELALIQGIELKARPGRVDPSSGSRRDLWSVKLATDTTL